MPYKLKSYFFYFSRYSKMDLIENESTVKIPVLGFTSLVVSTSRIFKLAMFSHVCDEINELIQTVPL